MSANGTSPGGPISPSAAPPVPDLNAVVHLSLNSIMIGHTFLTLLLPLLIALFYFSTPQSRRRPIFVLNVIAIILAFTAGVMIDAFAIHSILSPQSPWPPSMNIAIGIIGAFQSILVDLILLVRLTSVNPLSHLGPTRFAILTSLPILLKVARLVNLIIFMKVLADAARGPLGPENIAIVWASTPYLKFEWTAQVVDNAYASLAFLWTIRDRGNRQGVTSDIHPNRATFAQRMRTLSRIALSNFIIPSIFSIAQLIVVYRNVNVLMLNDVVLVNTMLAVFGVVFATVWAGNVSQRETRIDLWEDAHPADDGAVEKHPRRFAFPGLGTWRVASAHQTLAVGSMEYTTPVGETSLVERDEIVSEREKNGVLVLSTVAGSLEAKIKEM
ncbi:hypothetical protein EV363DRAFT_1391827 [Boletus edulis]|uniref:Uncharacterized protein n=1 Tax=Boletus edulis BED1 TaxID=1328754 RepID=A0AAD4GK11_BOLED|nr:hypothetical protein EV363DRAFT_1391827 [Boletus edulis]KAF8448752.1 hypothetical protein L210DRAFT_307258 [Boletus edulis BED1]